MTKFNRSPSKRYNDQTIAVVVVFKSIYYVTMVIHDHPHTTLL